jgi:hypothetical protein
MEKREARWWRGKAGSQINRLHMKNTNVRYRISISSATHSLEIKKKTP